jgi:hypothetical protein
VALRRQSLLAVFQFPKQVTINRADRYTLPEQQTSGDKNEAARLHADVRRDTRAPLTCLRHHIEPGFMPTFGATRGLR